MQIEMISIDDVTEYPSNPRHNEGAIDGVAKSIDEFGFKVPIIIDADNVIVAGHTRVFAARRLEMTEVPAIRADDLTPEQIKAFRIADNKLHELSTWDMELLPLEIRGLQDLDFDIEVLGFDDDELTVMLAPPEVEGLTDPDEVPEPPDEAITQPGDLYILGNHRLLCGDSASGHDLDRLLDAAAIHLVNCDPPYNVKVEPASDGADTGGQRPSWRSRESQVAAGIRCPGAGARKRIQTTPSKQRAKGRRLECDFMTDDEFEKVVFAWFSNIARVLDKGRSFYIWGGGYPAEAGTKSNNELFPYTLRQLDLRFSQLIIWNKGSGVINRKDFMGQYEVCFYGWKEGAAHGFFGPNNITDVWTVKKVNPQSMIHLTEKPTELATRAVQYSSRPGENVLDLFGGSGSTLIACEQHGRRAFLMELDPLYCDVIVQRWEGFTGNKAERVSADVEETADV